MVRTSNGKELTEEQQQKIQNMKHVESIERNVEKIYTIKGLSDWTVYYILVDSWKNCDDVQDYLDSIGISSYVNWGTSAVVVENYERITGLANIIKYTVCSISILVLFVCCHNIIKNEKENIRMRKIGFIFQEFYLNPNMTVEENIEQPMYINDQYDKEMIKSRTNELIETVGLSHRKKHFPKELSGGEQQRVAIARALANKPDIILADEPTGNLDKENETKIFEMLKILSQNNKCVIVVSHSNKIEQYADIVLKIKEGNIEINEIS